MERKKFFIGVFVLTGLVLGSLFTNAVYKDYLEYGGQMDSLVLSGKGLYISGSSLLPYILFKRGKQYGILFLIGFILKPVVLLYGGLFSLSFFLGSILSLQVMNLGIAGLLIVILSLFPHYICYGGSMYLLYQRNVRDEKKEEITFDTGHSFLNKFSIHLELILLVLGCFLESYVNPGILNMFSHLIK